jgi:hypothetical protein
MQMWGKSEPLYRGIRNVINMNYETFPFLAMHITWMNIGYSLINFVSVTVYVILFAT